VYLAAARAGLALNANQSFIPGSVPGNLHPRRYFFLGVMQELGKVVWGESCIGRKHFDCVGLVNYCLEEHTHLRGGWGFEIKQYFESKITGTSDKGRLPAANVVDGDICVRRTPLDHIGILFRSGNSAFVIQASETKKGLSDTDVYKPEDWGKVVRVRDEFLNVRKRRLKDGNGS
jgi:hypothetical protein